MSTFNWMRLRGLYTGYSFKDHKSLGEKLGGIYKRILEKNIKNLGNIRGVIFDKFSGGCAPLGNVGHIAFIEEACSARIGPGQLAKAEEHAGKDSALSKRLNNCKVYCVVAGDHLSFPGNDLYGNSSATHEGGISARTNLMQVVTGEKGVLKNGVYLPQDHKKGIAWQNLCAEKSITVGVGSISVVNANGAISKLKLGASSTYKPEYLDPIKPANYMATLYKPDQKPSQMLGATKTRKQPLVKEATTVKKQHPWRLTDNSYEQDFIAKGKKAKLGGAGEGGKYRHKETGIDYLIKRTATGNYSEQEKLSENFRSYDEVLASRLLMAAGGSAPYMYEVKDAKGNIYVASEILQGVNNLRSEGFKKSSAAAREDILSEQIVHAWLCNRDVINTSGENFVKDKDGRVFNVDLGNCLLSGFRGVDSGAATGNKGLRDKKNFVNGDPLMLIPGEGDASFGVLHTQAGKQVPMGNKEAIKKFFTEGVNTTTQRHAYLQGVLRVMQLSNEDVAAIVNQSGHAEEDKRIIIDALKDRKQKLIDHANKKYGPKALEEEEMAIELRKVMHKAGVFMQMPDYVKGDARVSWHSQCQNAFMPEVKFGANGSLLISATADPEVMKKILVSLKQIGVDCDIDGTNIKIKDSAAIFKQKVKAAVIADALQTLLGSYGFESIEANKKISDEYKQYSSPYFNAKWDAKNEWYAYKGDCYRGFRPKVVYIEAGENKGKLQIQFDESKVPAVEFMQLLIDKYGLIAGDIAYSKAKPNEIIVANPVQFMKLLQANTGARKTAVVSENEHGQIMAGRLDKDKKGRDGFATAGGGSDKPMNPKAAAAGEGGDEFGYDIAQPDSLVAIGSTVGSGDDNIFIAPPGATSKEGKPIGYKEFQDGTIKYYSFQEFRKIYADAKLANSDNPPKFDRTSIEYYVKFYQRQIQQELKNMGYDDVIVICSKKPETLGQIYIKPSISGGKAGVVKRITRAQDLEKLLRNSKVDFVHLEKDSKQYRKDGKHGGEVVRRDIFKVDSNLNPLQFLNFLRDKQDVKQAAAVATPPASHSTLGQAKKAATGEAVSVVSTNAKPKQPVPAKLQNAAIGGIPKATLPPAKVSAPTAALVKLHEDIPAKSAGSMPKSMPLVESKSSKAKASIKTPVGSATAGHLPSSAKIGPISADFNVPASTVDKHFANLVAQLQGNVSSNFSQTNASKSKDVELKQDKDNAAKKNTTALVDKLKAVTAEYQDAKSDTAKMADKALTGDVAHSKKVVIKINEITTKDIVDTKNKSMESSSKSKSHVGSYESYRMANKFECVAADDDSKVVAIVEKHPTHIATVFTENAGREHAEALTTAIVQTAVEPKKMVPVIFKNPAKDLNAPENVKESAQLTGMLMALGLSKHIIKPELDLAGKSTQLMPSGSHAAHAGTAFGTDATYAAGVADDAEAMHTVMEKFAKIKFEGFKPEEVCAALAKVGFIELGAKSPAKGNANAKFDHTKFRQKFITTCLHASGDCTSTVLDVAKAVELLKNYPSPVPIVTFADSVKSKGLSFSIKGAPKTVTAGLGADAEKSDVKPGKPLGTV